MKNTIQTKRSAKPAHGFRKLHARTRPRKRKLRAATAVADSHLDLESDVPNVGIGRALIVILALHIVAIAAIYCHSTFFGNEAEEVVVNNENASRSVIPGSSPATSVPAAALVAPSVETDSELGTGRCIVKPGQSYAVIAHERNVDETALRALNGNRALRAGVVLDLPAELSSRPVDVQVDPVPRKPRRVAAVETVVPPAAEVEPVHARAVVVEEDPAPKAVPVSLNKVGDSGQRYTVKSGDTVWRIASRYKVSRESLLEINGIKDPRKLYAGREIKIPVQ